MAKKASSEVIKSGILRGGDHAGFLKGESVQFQRPLQEGGSRVRVKGQAGVTCGPGTKEGGGASEGWRSQGTCSP